MKRYYLCNAYLLVAMFLCGVVVASAQDIPTISLSIPQPGQAGAPANGAQRLSPNSLLLRERAWTVNFGSTTLETGFVRISRSTSGSRTAFPIAYTLEYFQLPKAATTLINAFPFNTINFNRQTAVKLPNVSNDVRQLPAPVTSPSPFNTPFFSPAPPPPVPVAINGLQGDLSPTTATQGRISNVNDTFGEALSGFTWSESTNEQFVTFVARYSDQVFYPRNPGLQEFRVAILRILPSPSNPPAYQVQKGADSAFVILTDPWNTPPVITNALPDITMRIPRIGEVSEHWIDLESSQWRPDAIPRSVFYDDNYNILEYTATTSDAEVSARIVSSNLPPGNTQRTILYCTVSPYAVPNSLIRVRVRASDGSTVSAFDRALATDEFTITIRGSLFSTAVAETRTTDALPSITTSPNPVTDKCLVSTTIPDAGFFTLRVTDVLGTVVYNASVQGARGSEQQHTIDMAGFAAGTYFVEVNDGARTSSRKIVKR